MRTVVLLVPSARLDSRGVVLSLTRFLVVAPIAFVAACASGPSAERAYTVQPDDAIAVVYEQPENDLRQTLLTEGVIDARTLYSSGASDPLAKVLSPSAMQELLDALATYGFFANARPGLGGADFGRAPGLRVTINGDERVWSKSASMTVDDLTAYQQAWVAFQNIYNYTESFHVGRKDDAVFQEAERLRLRNEEALRRARESGSADAARSKGQP